jgi:proteasome assembly chaperone 2
MENKFVKLVPDANWSDYTFIVSCVSVGNIGQLATDLLISTLPNTHKAGYLISTLVQPIVGHDAFVHNSSELSLSCELYENPKLKLVICQQRAPLFKGKRNQFVNVLVDFVKAQQFKETVCLTSSHAYERLDSQLDGVQCRYLTSSPVEDSNMKSLNWKLLEKRTNHTDLNHNLVDGSDGMEKKLHSFIPGGGIAQKFLNTSQEYNLKSCVLLVFAHEGNNIPEAYQLVNYLNEWKEYLSQSNLQASNSTWRVPISWKYLWGDSRSLSQTF